MPTPYTSSLTRTADEKAGERVSVLDFGADPTGVGDSTAAFIAAIAAIVTKGRGIELYMPGGLYNVGHVALPSTLPGLVLSGDGEATVVQRAAAITPGLGWLDVQAGASDITLRNFVLDGAVTSRTGMNYSAITGGDPMLAALTTNSSIWVHENVSKFRMHGVTVRHTGGYATLFDARAGMIFDVRLLDCLFENNRPFAFGTSGIDLNYGSWSGGVFFKGDGTTAALNVVRNVLVRNCIFRRMMGNALWSHLYGVSALHGNFHWVGNQFLDCGLDAMLVAGVSGGSVANNTGRRIGYTTNDDVTDSTPKYLANHYAVGLDTAGLVKGVNYTGNSFLNCNGAAMDLDGYALGTVSGNVAIVSASGEPEYTEDSVASMGVGAGPITYGLQVSNSNNDPVAGTNVHIVGNTFINLAAGAIRLFATRNSQCAGNTVIHPAAAIIQPIVLGNIGVGANQRAYGNVVTGNRIDYSPGAAAGCIVENNNGFAFAGTDQNWVYENCITQSGTTALEFYKDAATVSTTKRVYSSQANALGGASESILQREGSGDLSLTRLYANEAGTQSLLLTLVHALHNNVLAVVGGPLLNISANGGATTGSISTGGRSTLPFDDTIATGKLFADAGLILNDATLAYPNDAKFDLLSDSYGLMRYNSTLKAFELSVAVAGGHRVWSSISTTASLWTASGSDIYNSNAGKVFVGATMDDGSGLKLQVTGSASASVGYFTPGAALNAIYAPNGGVTAANGTIFNASAGASAFQIKAGSVQGATNLLQILDNGGVPQIAVTPSYVLKFASDVGLARNAAGVVEVNSGTAGALRDLTARFVSLAGNAGTFNALQVLAGGAYVPDGFVTDQAVYLKSLGLHPNNPGAGYGALGYASGSQYYYWNGAAFASVDLAAVASGGLWNTTGSLLYPTSTSYNVLVGRSTDDGTAFKLQVAGSVSVSAGVVALQTIQSTIVGGGVAFQAGGGLLQIFGSGAMGLAGPILIGLASTDVSASLVAAASLSVATATANASVAGIFAAGGRAGLFSGHSGTGTFLPLAFDTSNVERFRVTPGGLLYVNRTTDDLTGAQVQIAGNLSVTGVAQTNVGTGLGFQVNSGVIQLYGTGLINAVNFNLDVSGAYQIGGVGAFRKSGGVLQWFDGAAWNNFVAGGAGVTTITGTANQVLANGLLTAQAGAVTLSLPQSIHLAAIPAFQGLLLSMPSNLNDGSGYLVQSNGGIEMVNAANNILSKGTAANAIYASAGGIAAISGFYVGVNGATQAISGTAVFVGPSINLNGGGGTFTVDAGGNLSTVGSGIFTSFVNTNLHYRIGSIPVFRISAGALQWSNDGATWNSFAVGAAGVSSVAGTVNQVFANGLLTPQSGLVILSLPQDIATASMPTFGGLLVNTTNDGSGYLLQADGGVRVKAAGTLLVDSAAANALNVPAGGITVGNPAGTASLIGNLGIIQQSGAVFVRLNATSILFDNGSGLNRSGYDGSNFNIASGTGMYEIASAGILRKSGGVLQWSHDGTTWNSFTTSPGAVASVNASGSGISVSPTTGTVFVSNTGVTSIIASSGLTANGVQGSLQTGQVTLVNTGILGLLAGTGVTFSGASNAPTISIGQNVSTSASPSFANLTISTQLVVTSGVTGAIKVGGSNGITGTFSNVFGLAGHTLVLAGGIVVGIS